MVVQLRENRARTFWPVVVSRWVYARVALGDKESIALIQLLLSSSAA